MISKELLSDVLGRDVDKVKGIEANTLIYGVYILMGGMMRLISTN
jgi:hypothetical protein